ncbi:MAG: hypothetical protein HYX80_08570 [Chloroflexi bacterium]|nr:hypothetical protein [Chloroflexota bacterium]
MTNRKWKTAGKFFGAAVTLGVLGLAAMAVNPVPAPWWITYVFYGGVVFVILGIVTVLITIVWIIIAARQWIKGLRIINISQSGTVNNAIVGDSNIVSAVAKVKQSNLLEHDGVYWELAGRRVYYGGGESLDIKGPLCPKHYTPLVFHAAIITIELNDDWLVSADRPLYCLDCGDNKTYTLGNIEKRIGESRQEAKIRFEGVIKRRSQGQED